MTSLTVQWRRRPYEDTGGGAFKSERNFLDFVVDGVSLQELFGRTLDQVTPLCREFSQDEAHAFLRRLLTTAESDVAGGRIALYVCAECGDLGCGATTCEIVRTPTKVVWRSFGFENNYEERVEYGNFSSVGPFEFEANAYDEQLKSIPAAFER